jgi:hypothetical protein
MQRPTGISAITSKGWSPIFRSEIGPNWTGPGFLAFLWPSAFVETGLGLEVSVLASAIHEAVHDLFPPPPVRVTGTPEQVRRDIREQLEELDWTPRTGNQVDVSHCPKFLFLAAVLVKRYYYLSGVELDLARVIGYRWSTWDVTRVNREAGYQICAAARDLRRWRTWPTPRVFQTIWFSHAGFSVRPALQHQPRMRGKKCRVLLAS